MRIPKFIHIIWVGDDSKRPVACIDSWRKNNPDWGFRLWQNRDLETYDWINQKHLQTLIEHKKWPAVADLMRYEILYREGGVYVDADSYSLRPLHDWLLEGDMFACWTNTISDARLINNAFMGSVAGNPFLKYVIDKITVKKNLFRRWSWSRMRFVPMGAWRSVGPYHLTQCVKTYDIHGYSGLTILPSHMFSPTHFRGAKYSGNGLVFADHQWGTTRKAYEVLSGRTTSFSVTPSLVTMPDLIVDRCLDQSHEPKVA